IFHLSTALAKDVWIHAVGIDESVKTQNFGDFYRTGRDFESACAASTRHPECHLFINEDRSLMVGEGVPIDLKRNSGPARSATLKTLIQQSLAKAGKNDTVII